MKKYYLLLLFMSISALLLSQKTITQPRFGKSTAAGLTINKIELTDSFTILSFQYTSIPGSGFYIPKESYILPQNSTQRLFAIKADKVELNKTSYVEKSGKADYTLYFPTIDTSTLKLEYGEGNEGGNWFIKDISLKNDTYKCPVPKFFIGNWYATDGSKDLIVCFYDSITVFKSQIWKYKNVTSIGSNYKVELVNSSGIQSLLVKLIDTTAVELQIPQKNTLLLSKNKKEVPGFTDKSEVPYSSAVFTKEEPTTYKGFIRYYDPKNGQNFGQLYVTNVLSGHQENYPIHISDDGTFSVTFPLSYPQSVMVRMPYANESIFMEPGKETFHLIDGGDWLTMHLFMGEMARVNSGIIATRELQYFDNNKLQDTILKISPDQYKAYCLQLLNWELPNLDSYADSHYLSPKAKQIKKFNLIYDAASHILEYKRLWESSYRKKNTISWENRETINVPTVDSTFYSVLNDQLVNDPLGIMSEMYFFFINDVKYLDLFRLTNYPSQSPIIIADLVKKSGKKLTSEEELLITKMKEIEDDSITSLKFQNFNMKYKEVIRSLYNKDLDLINKWSKNSSFIIFYDLEDSLHNRGIDLTPSEKEMIETAKSIKSKQQYIDENIFKLTHEKEIQAFNTHYKSLFTDYVLTQMMNYRDEKLSSLYKVNKGVASEIMYSQDLCRTIVEESTPMDTEELKAKLNILTTPFIYNYVFFQNEKIKKNIEANKLKTGYEINLVPDVEADKLFNSMIEKFKGKVVFVDFWATWCGPCRQGLERMRPLKEELQGKDIVFVYITNETSPIGTWNNMITDIKGEHFRVNPDQWNTLSSKFSINSIPHYLLVDKNGVVAKNNGMPSYDMDAMKKMFEEFMSK